MGRKDSSQTRVAPLFDQLHKRDPSGETWLYQLLALGSRPEATARIPIRSRLIDKHPKHWGSTEASLPAPAGLLEYLVQNMDEELVSKCKDSGTVLANRESLARREQTMIDKALRSLREGKRGKTWFVLEGPSRPDALLETSEFLVCIEGKRTEAACTTHTSWMKQRSQLLRHMDAAMEKYPSKDIFGLLIVEGPADGAREYWKAQCDAQVESDMVNASLPHRSIEQRAQLATGVLGVTTWQAVCAATNVDFASLPDEI